MNLLYFDLETQKSAEEVGGWNNKRLMRMSFAVTYSTQDDRFRGYEEADVPALIADLSSADRVIGYNIIDFDYQVLSGYASPDFSKWPTLDLLADISRTLGFRVKLDSVAQATLQTGKSADGLAALQWFKEGRMAEIALYCREDVRITRDIHRFGATHQCVYYFDKKHQRLPIPVQW